MTTGPGGTRPQGDGTPYPHVSPPPHRPRRRARATVPWWTSRLLVGVVAALASALLCGVIVVMLAVCSAGEVGAPTVVVPATPTARPHRQ